MARDRVPESVQASRVSPAGARVLDRMRGAVTVERASSSLEGANRVAVVAHFAQTSRLTRSFERLVTELHDTGYAVLISSSCTDARPLQWQAADAPDVTILRRPNEGYDFGSWAVGLDRFPAVRSAPYVIVANDSMVGPFSSLGPHLERFESSNADVWGMTSSYQFQPHLQSYFLGFRDGLLDSKLMREFWSGVRLEPTKDHIIHRYELGLSRLLLAEGYILDAEFDAAGVVGHEFNPVIIGWNRLLELGYPFVKRELVTNPSVVHGAAQLPSVIRQMFGEDVEDWF